MKLPDGNTLMHGSAPYDPVKAHEYYIRTRQLKGRSRGKSKPLTRKQPLLGGSSSPTYSIKLDTGETVILTAKQLAEQKAYAAKRVREIKGRLKELSSTLRKAMSEARKKKDAAERNAKKPETLQEKNSAAREAKKYRDSHKTSLATKSRIASKKADKKESANTDPVAELETKIAQIKDTLRTAVANQRALVGATRNK